MRSEDNFLRLDPYNYDSEIEYLLDKGMFNYDDCVALHENKQMSEIAVQKYFERLRQEREEQELLQNEE